MSRSRAWLSLRIAVASTLGALALSAAGCVATPLPDPPSVRPSAMSLVSTQPDQLQLSGTDGAIGGGVARLRVTEPITGDVGGRVETAVTAGGAFTAAVGGTLADTLYLEAVEPTGDVFLAAVALRGGIVVTVDPGTDRDADRSPDAVDCAPDDPLLVARECPTGMVCGTDADCTAVRGSCVAGVCLFAGCVAEICSNGVDDDCNGVIDDGC